uniref:DUF8173 domain-containing protein n=1 Tax=candidate division WOR-3 bacterium TaxID=2052148 RepID=A0A7C4TH30_UNCW3
MGYLKILLVFSIILAWIIPANSLTIKSGREVIIGADEVVDDDLIAFAQTVKIEGRVNGDVFALAREGTIENIIQGSIYAGGAEIEVNSKNCRSLWAFCGSLKTSTEIGNNLLFFGGALETEEGNIVQKDLIAFGGEVQVGGKVNGKVKGNMGKFKLNGEIKSAEIEADKVNIDSNGVVMGELIIKSKEEPVIHSRARILGKTDFKKIEEKVEQRKRGSGIKGFLRFLFFLSKLVIGLILIAIFKPYIKKTNQILKEDTWKSLGFGFLTIIVIPVVTVITLATIIGIPIAILGVFLFLTLAYVSGIIFATGFGEWLVNLVKRDFQISPFLSLILGLIIITIVSQISYLGLFIHLAVFFFGTGMLFLLVHRLWKDSLAREEK